MKIAFVVLPCHLFQTAMYYRGNAQLDLIDLQSKVRTMPKNKLIRSVAFVRIHPH